MDTVAVIFPGERREIERGLRDGRILGVVATNALELGIDVGSLNACVMARYPGTIASTWSEGGHLLIALDDRGENFPLKDA